MLWQKPRAMVRNPGNPNVTILLADRSTSMSCAALCRTEEAIPHFHAAIPGLRVFAFHADAIEVDCRAGERGSLAHCAPPRGQHKNGPRYVNSTYLGHCLKRLARLNPSRTIVLSDGGVADQKLALDIASQMTGRIDAYFCSAGNREWQDEGFMRDLARYGRFAEIEHMGGNIGQELHVSLTRRIHHHYLPDLHYYPEERK